MKKVLLFLLCILNFALCVNAQEGEDRGYIVKVGDMAPDFELTMDNGKTVRLSELRGKVVMLQFTASWCGICRKEMPYIESDIWQKYKGNKNFVLVGIDREETAEKVAYLKEVTKITYPLAYDTAGDVFRLYAHANAGITRNVLIDKKGRIVLLTRKFEEQEFKGLCEKIGELLK
ncbi:MAG: TlpA family protein disulfide reductase [Paludibacteraceae bacterium]|nr:TlpA family protein disulfide reductase [Paludibacteraceae bacterium]